ncbi:hypothetical protein MmiEs2_04920 [Methanimicrococcus stummii]|uniref:Uncharacterized protein n=1 Tax=Methanimicrococcus stummii TaxID=3028294 RepID=A0AA96VL62_9EURY|nr:hypothetical protein [Methanimicrococcus sp. Es2]WNY28307.1 hypothetical protein MmiEs2_04920 [Methanimicrococcus sp. Es2]
MAQVLIPMPDGTAVEAKSKYDITSVIGDWTGIGNGKTTDNTEFLPIMEMRTGAQSVNAFGFGALEMANDLRGDMKLVVKDSTGAVIPGTVRLWVTNARKFGVSPIMEDRTERMSESDKRTAYKLGLVMPAAREDSYLMISFRADTSGKTIDLTKSEMLMPITSYMV